MWNCKLPNNLFRLSLEITMRTSPIHKAVTNCELSKCFNVSTAPLAISSLISLYLDLVQKIPFQVIALVLDLISSVPCLLCFQRDCLLEQVGFIFSQNTAQIPCQPCCPGLAKESRGDFACTSPDSLRAFLEAVLCKMSGPAVFPLLFPWQVSIHPYFT